MHFNPNRGLDEGDLLGLLPVLLLDHAGPDLRLRRHDDRRILPVLHVDALLEEPYPEGQNDHEDPGLQQDGQADLRLSFVTLPNLPAAYLLRVSPSALLAKRAKNVGH